MAKVGVSSIEEQFAVKHAGEVYVKSLFPRKGGLADTHYDDVGIDKGSFYPIIGIDGDGDVQVKDDDGDDQYINKDKATFFVKPQVGDKAKILSTEKTTPEYCEHDVPIGSTVEIEHIAGNGTIRVSDPDGDTQWIAAGDYVLASSGVKPEIADGKPYKYEGKSYILRARMPKDGELVLITENGADHDGDVVKPTCIDPNDDSIEDDSGDWHFVNDGDGNSEFLTLEEEKSASSLPEFFVHLESGDVITITGGKDDNVDDIVAEATDGDAFNHPELYVSLSKIAYIEKAGD